jgi:hypothetical protein
MAATKTDIRRWLNEGREKQATHMLVVCDTFDYDDYPVYVSTDEDVQKAYRSRDGKNMQKVMEVYNLGLDLEMQLQEHRAFHF